MTIIEQAYDYCLPPWEDFLYSEVGTERDTLIIELLGMSDIVIKLYLSIHDSPPLEILFYDVGIYTLKKAVKEMNNIKEAIKYAYMVDEYRCIYYKDDMAYTFYIINDSEVVELLYIIEYNKTTNICTIVDNANVDKNILIVDLARIKAYEGLIMKYTKLPIKIFELFAEKCLSIETKNEYKLML